jgi:hypothetical protein
MPAVELALIVKRLAMDQAARALPLFPATLLPHDEPLGKAPYSDASWNAATSAST